MALIDGYYKITLEWDADYTLHRLTLHEAIATDDVVADLVKVKFVAAYNDIPCCFLDGQKDYSIEYRTSENKLATLRFYTWWQAHGEMGIVESTLNTSDCLLFRTDHQGAFEIYVFKGLKHKENDLYGMLIVGHLDEELRSLLKTQPF